MRIFVFGSSLTSCYWNGAATYYRGIYRNLSRFGHEITFAEPDIYDRQRNRDLISIDYAAVRVYRTPDELNTVVEEAAGRDLVIKHSGVGADDEYLEAEVLKLSPRAEIAFWDVDAPATLVRVEGNPQDPFRTLIPRYDFIFTYGGGRSVITRYRRLGARNCYPIYNALDPDTHYPVEGHDEYRSDLAFVGHRLPDREQRVEEFFFRAAELVPEYRFLLGGEGWGTRRLPKNVRWIGHVGSLDHNRINCSARMVLNVNRESMADVGFSPPTRVFEAAGAGACLITDRWLGIEEFFAPDREILVAGSGEEVAHYLAEVPPSRARLIGGAMRRRALKEHTYELRARQVDHLLRQRMPADSEEREPLAQSAL